MSADESRFNRIGLEPAGNDRIWDFNWEAVTVSMGQEAKVRGGRLVVRWRG